MVPVASVTVPPKMNLVGATVVPFQIIVDVGVAALAAAVAFVGALLVMAPVLPWEEDQLSC